MGKRDVLQQEWMAEVTDCNEQHQRETESICEWKDWWLEVKWWKTAASLRLASPGAVTDGVTLYFFLKKVTTFFILVNLLKSDDFFSHCHPLPPCLSPNWAFVQCSL